MRPLFRICGYSFIYSLSRDKDDHFKKQHVNVSKKASNLIKIFKEKTGAPGISVNVNVDGIYSYDYSYGYSDVENLVKCKSDSLMRIASISKSFTSLIAAKLLDEGLLDLDKNINEYLPDFPIKSIESDKVVITCRQLLSHRSGLRSYKMVKNSKLNKNSENDSPEFLNKDHCPDTLSTLKCFQNDPLQNSPGEKFFYSVYGYVLLGYILEKVAEKSVIYGTKDDVLSKNTQKLENMFNILFKNLGLTNTHCEYHETMYPNRSRQYKRMCSKKCKLETSPYVDNSCKWTAGGLISTCHDLSKFAQNLVDIWFGKIDGVISRSSLETLWKPIPGNDIKVDSYEKWSYCLGWCVKEDSDRFLVGHLGGASGGTSALLINISKKPGCDNYIIVTVLCNLERLSDSIGDLALEISKLFEEDNK